jgi:hypothetical protein
MSVSLVMGAVPPRAAAAIGEARMGVPESADMV